jgi:formylglycine-generating enzyme required for sulfatase activity/HEAT repeat protein
MGLDVYRDWLGIPEEEHPPNFYRLFGLETYAVDPEEIERATRRTIGEIRKRQLDPAHKKEVQDLLTELARARAVLKDQDRRFQYDRWLMKSRGKGEPPAFLPSEKAKPEPERPAPPTPVEKGVALERPVREPAGDEEPVPPPRASEEEAWIVQEPVPTTRRMPAVRPFPWGPALAGSAVGLLAVIVVSVLVLLSGRSDEAEKGRKPPPKPKREVAKKDEKPKSVPSPDPGKPGEAPRGLSEETKALVKRYTGLLDDGDDLFRMGRFERANEKYGEAFRTFTEVPPSARPENGRFPWDAKGLVFLSRNRHGHFEFRWERDGAVMIYVPGGIFPAGHSEKELESLVKDVPGVKEALAGQMAFPRRQVHISSFLIDKYEVTNKTYAEFLEAAGKGARAGAFRHPLDDPSRSFSPSRPAAKEWASESLPVTGIDWYDAFAHARWAGKTLPTVLQWEKAACWEEHAGRIRRFPFGDRWDPGRTNSQDRWADSRVQGPKESWSRFLAGAPWKSQCFILPVGSMKDISPYGVHDMTGNLVEFCLESACRFPASGRGEFSWMVSPRRACKGGGWWAPALMAWPRDVSFWPASLKRLPYFGFRTVRNIVTPSDRLEIVLPKTKVQAGERITLRARIRDAEGGERDVYPRWETSLGAVDAATGLFQCLKTGPVELRAVLEGCPEPAKATIEVEPYTGRGWTPSENQGIPGPETVPPALTRGHVPGEYIHKKTGMVFVFVPGGAMSYGNSASESGVAVPLRVKEFFIGKYEVTVDQFDAFWEAAGLDAASFGHPEEPAGHVCRPFKVSRSAEHDPKKTPVSDVDWFAAFAFAAWAGLDLPTELQWETAASWDPRNGRKRAFPWGDAWKRDRCNSASRWAGEDLATLEAVQKKLLEKPDAPQAKLLDIDAFPSGASPVGALDMAGSVHEWCLDLLDRAFLRTLKPGTVDALCRSRTRQRALRGGSLFSPIGRLGSAFSGTVDAGDKGWEMGLRCVLNPALAPSRLSIVSGRKSLVPGFREPLRARLHYDCGRFHFVDASWSALGGTIDSKTGEFKADVEGLYVVTARHAASGLNATIEMTVEADSKAPWPASMNGGLPGPADLPEGIIRGKNPGEYVWERDGSIMVYFPRGKFVVGQKAYKNARWVEFDGFFIDRYEVSKEKFKDYLQAVQADGNPKRFHYPSPNRRVMASPFGSFEGGPDGAPAVCMSWYEAWEYARWLGKSLPTAAEWEAAASVHPVTKKQSNFPWGRGYSQGVANTREYWKTKGAGEGKPTPPGMFPKDRSPCGCMDMGGNVSEWCLYDGLPPVTKLMPSTTTPDGREVRIRFMEEMGAPIRPLRGGCYFFNCSWAKSQMGKLSIPDVGGRWTGFRCVVRRPWWKTFVRLAKSALEGGRSREAKMLIQEIELPWKPVRELVEARKGAYADLLISAEKCEEEGEAESAQSLYKLAEVVVPDATQERVLKERAARAGFCSVAFKDAERALQRKSKTHLQDALSGVRKVIQRYAGSVYETRAREKEKRLLEALNTLGVPEPEPAQTKAERILKLIEGMKTAHPVGGALELTKAIEGLKAEDKGEMPAFLQAFNAKKRLGWKGQNTVLYILRAIAQLGRKAGGETAQLAAKTFEEEIRRGSQWTRDAVIGEAGKLGPFGACCGEAIGAAIDMRKDPRSHVSFYISLGEIGPGARGALPALRKALKKPDMNSQEEHGFNATVYLLTTLSRIVLKTEAGAWAPDLLELAKKSPMFHKDILSAAARMGCADQGIIDLALKCARGRDKRLGQHAIEKLGDLGPDAWPAVKPLTTLLKSQQCDRQTRKKIADTLRRIGRKSRSANSVLINMFNAEKLDVFSMAFVMAGQGPSSKRYLPSIEAAFKEWELRNRRSVDPLYKAYVQTALGAKPVGELVGFLKDRSPEKRVIVADYLAGMGSMAKSAAPRLIELTTDSNEKTRRAMARTLGRIGDKSERVEDTLRALLLDSDIEVRTEAFRALENLGLWRNEEEGGNKKEKEKRKDPPSKVERGQTEEVPLKEIERILRLLRSRNRVKWNEGSMAAMKLGPISSKGMRRLVKAFDAKKVYPPESRSVLCDVFGQANWAEGETLALVLKALERGARDKHPQVHGDALRAFGELGPRSEGQVSLLVHFLRLKEPVYKTPLISYLGKIGPAARSSIPDIMPFIDEVLKNEEWAKLRGIAALKAIRLIVPRKDAQDLVPRLVALARKSDNLYLKTLHSLSRIAEPTEEILSLFRRGFAEEDDWSRGEVFEYAANFREGAAPLIPHLLEILKRESKGNKIQSLIARIIAGTGRKAKTTIPDCLKLCKEGKLKFKDAAIVLASQGPDGMKYLSDFREIYFKEIRTMSDRIATLHKDYLEAVMGTRPILTGFVQRHSNEGARILAMLLGYAGTHARDAVPVLLQWIGNENVWDRREAARTLGMVGDTGETVEEALRKALYDPEVIVREEAFRALENLGLWRTGGEGGEEDGGK